MLKIFMIWLLERHILNTCDLLVDWRPERSILLNMFQLTVLMIYATRIQLYCFLHVSDRNDGL